MEDDPFDVPLCSGDTHNFQPVNEQGSAGTSKSASRRSQKKKVLVARARELEEQQQWQM